MGCFLRGLPKLLLNNIMLKTIYWSFSGLVINKHLNLILCKTFQPSDWAKQIVTPKVSGPHQITWSPEWGGERLALSMSSRELLPAWMLAFPAFIPKMNQLYLNFKHSGFLTETITPLAFKALWLSGCIFWDLSASIITAQFSYNEFLSLHPSLSPDR